MAVAYNEAVWRRTVRNGRIPDRLLAVITDPTDYDADLGGPARMHPEAAWNFERMRADARADGVTLSISYSYRTLVKQVEKWENYQAGGNLAAKPGTSNHGWATALDLNIPAYPAADTNPAFRWLKANAHRYGFFNNDAPSEPWHWDYEGGHPIEEDDMADEELREGVNAFLEGKEPTKEGPARKMYRALERAASKPAPAEHTHPAGMHTHMVTGQAK